MSSYDVVKQDKMTAEVCKETSDSIKNMIILKRAFYIKSYLLLISYLVLRLFLKKYFQ